MDTLENLNFKKMSSKHKSEIIRNAVLHRKEEEPVLASQNYPASEETKMDQQEDDWLQANYSERSEKSKSNAAAVVEDAYSAIKGLGAVRSGKDESRKLCEN